MKAVVDLPPGPLDIVGDVHGEWQALRALLNHLGYDDHGLHPNGRTLVFVGDLVDRGPDSPAVLEWVLPKVSRGIALSLLGNHELNLLRGDRKEGNGWFFDDNHDQREGHFGDCRDVDPRRRSDYLDHLNKLPIAAERSDLRIVHACWDQDAIDYLRGIDPSTDGRLAQFDRCERELEQQLTLLSATPDFNREQIAFHRLKAGPRPDLGRIPVEAYGQLAAYQQLKQNGNPVRLLTSGPEIAAESAFHAGGKLRLLRRLDWWEAYSSTKAVVFGHYWRRPDTEPGPTHWHGTSPSLSYCVDFSVGRRYLARAHGSRSSPGARLGALQWPEAVIVFDDGERLRTLRA